MGSQPAFKFDYSYRLFVNITKEFFSTSLAPWQPWAGIKTAPGKWGDPAPTSPAPFCSTVSNPCPRGAAATPAA
jgi:hypothetical protein